MIVEFPEMVIYPECDVTITYFILQEDEATAPSFAIVDDLAVIINSKDSSDTGSYTLLIKGIIEWKTRTKVLPATYGKN